MPDWAVPLASYSSGYTSLVTAPCSTSQMFDELFKHLEAK